MCLMGTTEPIGKLWYRGAKILASPLVCSCLKGATQKQDRPDDTIKRFTDLAPTNAQFYILYFTINLLLHV
jgi:hypothetical protein